MDKEDFELWREEKTTKYFIKMLEEEILHEQEYYGGIDTNEPLKEYGNFKKQQGIVFGIKKAMEIAKTLGED